MKDVGPREHKKRLRPARGERVIFQCGRVPPRPLLSRAFALDSGRGAERRLASERQP